MENDFYFFYRNEAEKYIKDNIERGLSLRELEVYEAIKDKIVAIGALRKLTVSEIHALEKYFKEV